MTCRGGQHTAHHLKLIIAAGVQHLGKQGRTRDVLVSSKAMAGFISLLSSLISYKRSFHLNWQILQGSAPSTRACLGKKKPKPQTTKGECNSHFNCLPQGQIFMRVGRPITVIFYIWNSRAHPRANCSSKINRLILHNWFS